MIEGIRVLEISHAVAGDKSWSSFCSSLGSSDLLKMRTYATNADRVKHKKPLERTVSNRLRRMTTDDVVTRLMDSEVPFSRMNTVKSLLGDPHFLGTGALKSYSYLGKGFRTVVSPTIIDGLRPYNRKSPPKLGSDTESVPRELLQMKASELDELRKRNVISS
jgi:crotonobetainyl-CoA:carnitine CoA-transferase CaiB-like acyl-CoA transferase